MSESDPPGTLAPKGNVTWSDTFSLQEVLELLGSLEGKVAFALNESQQIIAASYNSFDIMGIYPTELFGKSWQALALPMSFMPWRKRHTIDQFGVTQLYAWHHPSMLCDISQVKGHLRQNMQFAVLTRTPSQTINQALSGLLSELEDFIFPVCLSSAGTMASYMNNSAKDLAAVEGSATSASVFQLFDKFSSLPKPWVIDQKLAETGVFVFGAQANPSAAYKQSDLDVYVMNIPQRSGTPLRMWVVIPHFFREFVSQYVIEDTDDHRLALADRLKRVIEAMYTMGFDVSREKPADKSQISTRSQVNRMTPFEMLSQRQEEILYYISQGMTHAEIARRLDLKTPTVKTHVAALYKKLNVRNKTEALMLAEQSGWLPRLRHHYAG